MTLLILAALTGALFARNLHTLDDWIFGGDE